MKKIKRILLISFFISFYSCSKKQLNNNNALFRLNKTIKNTSKDSTTYYLNKTSKLINEFTADSLKAEYLFLKANFFFYKNKKDSAFLLYNNVIKFTKNKITTNRENKYFLITANKYIKEKNYLNSLGILNIYENVIIKDDYKNLATLNYLKEFNYSALQNFKKATEHNLKAIKYYNLNNDSINVINSLIHNTELNYYYLHNKKKAYHVLDSIGNLKNWNDFYIKYKYYNLYGLFRFFDGKYKSAYKNYLKALPYIKTSPYSQDSINLVDNYANISEVLIYLKKYKLAKKYIDTIDCIYKKNSNIDVAKFHLQNKLRLSYLTKSNYDDVSNGIDSIFTHLNRTHEKRINTELTALKNATEKEKILILENKNSKIINLKLKKNQLLLFSGLSFLFLSTIIGILYYRQQKLTVTKNNILMQQRLFRSQMNPHFTSNILYTIQRLIKKDSKLANKYLIYFSRLLRITLENSLENFVSLEKELEALSKYLSLQQLRHPNKFDFYINTINIEEESLIHIPPMLIQPFAENAIEHGFEKINYKGKLEINLTLQKNYLFCEIEDNGLGINKKNNTEEHVSTSSKLIQDLLVKMTKKKIQISSSLEKGTTIKLNIPFKIA